MQIDIRAHALALTVLSTTVAGQLVHHVDAAAPPGGTGTTWMDAFTDLQDALDIAASGDEIWIAAGTYQPSSVTALTTPPGPSFVVPDGVSLRGGFAGDEASPAERDIAANPSVLDGDFPGFSDAFSVLILPSHTTPRDLDGLVVRGGEAFDIDETGGGLRVLGGTAPLTIVDCRFEWNEGGLGGGIGIVDFESEVQLVRCVLDGNYAQEGGGLYVAGGDPSLHVTECTVTDNDAQTRGAGLAIMAGQATIHDSQFGPGPAAVFGGGLYADAQTTVTACTFSGLFSGSADGAGLMNAGTMTVSDTAFLGNFANNGGAIANAGELLLERCDVLGNGADFYGAMTCDRATSTTIVDCRFEGNSSNGGAGAIGSFSSPLEIHESSFVGNSTDLGIGAIEAGSADVVVSRCHFADNSAQVVGALRADSATISHTEFVDNQGDTAGAFAGSGTIDACRFVANRTAFGGGAVNLAGGTIRSSLFHDNEAGGFGAGAIAFSDDTVIVNCTIADNVNDSSVGAGGVAGEGAAPGTLTIHDSILWNNTLVGTTGEGAQVSSSGAISISTSCVEGWTGAIAGAGSFDADPSFTDVLGADATPGTLDDDYRLTSASPCIDAGDGTSQGADTTDLDCDMDTSEPPPLDLAGWLRRADDPLTPDGPFASSPALDLGAYEYVATPHDPTRWQLLCSGSTGTSGVPLLVGLGTLEPASLVEFSVVDAAPLTSAFFVVGTELAAVPLKGGTLFPQPALVIAGIGLDAQGRSTFGGLWPAGLPTDLDVFFQAWIVDAGGSTGFASTNGLRATTP